jgi:thiamine biosynthesis lipoprotein
MNTRRRFLSILAGVSALGPLSAAWAVNAPAPSVWRGTAMGALASLTLLHPDHAKAQALIRDCVAEVQRLEAILSLYRADSALSRLNAAGELPAPPMELVELLSASLELSRRSGGAFDPTVQPLYRLYAAHFDAPGATASGPSPQAIARVLPSIGYAAVEVDAERIRLHRPGMALTLNGIAQGYVTDRVAALLRRAGFDDVLIDMGEARALGHRPGGGAWRAAVADPRRPGRSLLDLRLGEDRGNLPALATSAGAGTQFGPDPRIHHLLDPHTGRSANHWLSVSVAAPSATLADGLSTTLSVLAPARGAALLRDYPAVRAYFADGEGRVLARGALSASAHA